MKSLHLMGWLFFMAIGLYGQQINTPAPNFSHRTLDHGQISLSDFTGKVVYLFFFGWS